MYVSVHCGTSAGLAWWLELIVAAVATAPVEWLAGLATAASAPAVASPRTASSAITHILKRYLRMDGSPDSVEVSANENSRIRAVPGHHSALSESPCRSPDGANLRRRQISRVNVP